MTYLRSDGLFGDSGGVQNDNRFRICMHREDNIDRWSVSESVSRLTSLLGVSHHRLSLDLRRSRVGLGLEARARGALEHVVQTLAGIRSVSTGSHKAQPGHSLFSSPLLTSHI